jgi:hypothetical protein
MSFVEGFWSLRLRTRALFRREQAGQEIDDELRDHLDEQIAQNVAAGMPAEEARSQAVRDLGGMTRD